MSAIDLIYGQTERLVTWAREQGGIYPRQDAVAIGLGNDEAIRAAVIYDNFSDCDCGIHIVSDGSKKWLSRRLLYAGFAHPFIQWGMRRVTGLVPAKNEAALRFDRHLGFREEGRLIHALPDDDIIILGMLREECRFIPEQIRSQPHGR